MNTTSSQIFISAVEGNRQRLDGGAMFGNVPRALWQQWLEPDEHGRVELNCRALLIEVGETKILCEAGIGAFMEPKLADRFGVVESEHMLLKNLSTLGIKPGDIDFVIMSHLHFDHAGGLLPPYKDIVAGNNNLVFPNAKFIVGEEAYARSKDPHERDRASFIPGLSDKLEASGRLRVVKGDGSGLPVELKNLFHFQYTNGHTPGQMHTLLLGNKTKVFFAGDLIPGIPWVHVPITMGYDRFPELLIDEKKELYNNAEPEGWLLFFTHDPKTAIAKICKDEKGRYRAIESVARPVRQLV